MKRFKVIQFFAWIDIVLGITLVLPKVGAFVLRFLHELVMEEPLTLDVYHFVLMQMLGVMILLWGLVRLRQTALWQIMYDCLARLLVCTYLGFYCYNGQKMLFFFIIIEVFGFYQLRFISPKKT